MEICSEIYVKESILGGMRRGKRRGWQAREGGSGQLAFSNEKGCTVQLV